MTMIKSTIKSFFFLYITLYILNFFQFLESLETDCFGWNIQRNLNRLDGFVYERATMLAQSETIFDP